LKKVSGKKERDAANAEKEKLAKEEKEEDEQREDETETKDLLGDQDNQDVIF